MAIGIYLYNNPISKFFVEVKSNPRLFLLYFIPSGLYCIYNNLAFVSLVNFDPTTYYILLQLRMVVTGIMYECVFNRKLTRWQWVSLFLITIGCLVKNSSGFSHSSETETETEFSMVRILNASLFWIIVQIFCSCFAGVYTEFLVKDTGADVHLMVQNTFMYIDSIVCNFIGILMFPTTDPKDATMTQSFFDSPFETFSRILFDPLVFLVMFNNSLCGIITSLFLKNFNSILKIFASAMELIITAVVCWIIFSIPIDEFTIVAIFIVSLATYIYAHNPMSSLPPRHSSSSTTSSPSPILYNHNNNRIPSSKKNKAYFSQNVEDTKKLLDEQIVWYSPTTRSSYISKQFIVLLDIVHSVSVDSHTSVNLLPKEWNVFFNDTR